MRFRPNVAMGQKPTFRGLRAMSALPPKADLKADIVAVCRSPVSAKSCRERGRQTRCLFNYLVGALLKKQRHVESNFLGSLEIDDKFELGRLHYGKVSRLFTLENTACADAHPAV